MRYALGQISLLLFAVGCAEGDGFDNTEFSYDTCMVPACINLGCADDDITDRHARWLMDEIAEAGLQRTVRVSRLEYVEPWTEGGDGRVRHELQWQVRWLRHEVSGWVSTGDSAATVLGHYRDLIAKIADDMPTSVIDIEDVVRLARSCNGIVYDPCTYGRVSEGKIVVSKDNGHCVGPSEVEIDLATGDSTCTPHADSSWGDDCD